jgi:predicted nucleic acid-binding protein
LKQRRVLVFLDACVLIAASHSPSGGSALVIEICQGHLFKSAVTIEVLLETRVNIIEKFGEPELINFYKLLAALDPEMIPIPEPAKIEQYQALVVRKDLHVLAAALSCGVEYLITLDRRHFMTPIISAAGLPIKILTPGDFLKEIPNTA